MDPDVTWKEAVAALESVSKAATAEARESALAEYHDKIDDLLSWVSKGGHVPQGAERIFRLYALRG